MQYIDTVPVASKKGTLLTRNGKQFQTAYGVGCLMGINSVLMSKLGITIVITAEGKLQLKFLSEIGKGKEIFPYDHVVAIQDSESQTWDLYLSSDEDLWSLAPDS